MCLCCLGDPLDPSNAASKELNFFISKWVCGGLGDFHSFGHSCYHVVLFIKGAIKEENHQEKQENGSGNPGKKVAHYKRNKCRHQGPSLLFNLLPLLCSISSTIILMVTVF